MKVTLAVPILCAEHLRKTFHGSQAVGAGVAAVGRLARDRARR